MTHEAGDPQGGRGRLRLRHVLLLALAVISAVVWISFAYFSASVVRYEQWAAETLAAQQDEWAAEYGVDRQAIQNGWTTSEGVLEAEKERLRKQGEAIPHDVLLLSRLRAQGRASRPVLFPKFVHPDGTVSFAAYDHPHQRWAAASFVIGFGSVSLLTIAFAAIAIRRLARPVLVGGIASSIRAKRAAGSLLEQGAGWGKELVDEASARAESRDNGRGCD